RGKPVLLAALTALPSTEVDASGIRRDRILMESRPFLTRRAEERDHFVAVVAAEIRRRMEAEPPLAQPPGYRSKALHMSDEDDAAGLERLSRKQVASRRSGDVVVAPRASETGFDPARVGLVAGRRPVRAQGAPVLAVDRLVQWAASVDPDGPRLCALLG